jgi:two-component system, NarL family, response regulator NreC
MPESPRGSGLVFGSVRRPRERWIVSQVWNDGLCRIVVGPEASARNAWGNLILAISIVLADDHSIMRRGLKALFEGELDFSVMGVASDVRETLSLAERLKPDVLVLDLMMPGLNGLEALNILRDRAPQTRTVVFSRRHNCAFVTQALRNGATGYVVKGASEESLVRAVKEARAGRRFLSPPVTEIPVGLYAGKSETRPFDPHEMLTRRQREVLQLAAEGKTSTKIGAVLKISHRTVENHRAMLMDRLGLRNQTDLILYAIRRGLISPDERA